MKCVAPAGLGAGMAAVCWGLHTCAFEVSPESPEALKENKKSKESSSLGFEFRVGVVPRAVRGA